MDERAKTIIVGIASIAVIAAWLLLLREVSLSARALELSLGATDTRTIMEYIKMFSLAVVGGLVVSIFPTTLWETMR